MASFNIQFGGNGSFNAKFEGNSGSFDTKFDNVSYVPIGKYADLPDKPSIEGNVLEGDKTFQQLGMGAATVQEVEAILYLD